MKKIVIILLAAILLVVTITMFVVIKNTNNKPEPVLITKSKKVLSLKKLSDFDKLVISSHNAGDSIGLLTIHTIWTEEIQTITKPVYKDEVSGEGGIRIETNTGVLAFR